MKYIFLTIFILLATSLLFAQTTPNPAPAPDSVDAATQARLTALLAKRDLDFSAYQADINEIGVIETKALAAHNPPLDYHTWTLSADGKTYIMRQQPKEK